MTADTVTAGTVTEQMVREEREMGELGDLADLGELDEPAFSALAERHRRELHVHCYRMLGSFEEAEDQVQETLLRAWRSRGSFAGGDGLRAWLYKIATNTCLDALRSRSRRPVASYADLLGRGSLTTWPVPGSPKTGSALRAAADSQQTTASG